MPIEIALAWVGAVSGATSAVCNITSLSIARKVLDKFPTKDIDVDDFQRAVEDLLEEAIDLLVQNDSLLPAKTFHELMANIKSTRLSLGLLITQYNENSRLDLARCKGIKKMARKNRDDAQSASSRAKEMNLRFQKNLSVDSLHMPVHKFKATPQTAAGSVDAKVENKPKVELIPGVVDGAEQAALCVPSCSRSSIVEQGLTYSNFGSIGPGEDDLTFEATTAWRF